MSRESLGPKRPLIERLELRHPVSVEGFKGHTNARETRLYIKKQEEGPWRGLTKVKDRRVQVDIHSFVDSDQEEADFDQSGMQPIPRSL